MGEDNVSCGDDMESVFNKLIQHKNGALGNDPTIQVLFKLGVRLETLRTKGDYHYWGERNYPQYPPYDGHIYRAKPTTTTEDT